MRGVAVPFRGVTGGRPPPAALPPFAAGVVVEASGGVDERLAPCCCCCAPAETPPPPAAEVVGAGRSVGGPSATSSAKAARTESVGFAPSCSASRRSTRRASPSPPSTVALRPRVDSRSEGGTTRYPTPLAAASATAAAALAPADDAGLAAKGPWANAARERRAEVRVWKRPSRSVVDSAESWTAVCVTWWIVSICVARSENDQQGGSFFTQVEEEGRD